ncbi:hypothetical protein AN948_13995 [Rhodococcus sp. ADH]|uniref:hypothetical protein n=1 Tax=Rhodococcus sp. ADH TaxID=224843 RepID=UPI0006BA4FFC|nr:hypothetical protein [Rhodococcus sp. ADH]KPH18946.1 hypothetical protein AN948_13995 [Rhodococcus sp. ADH]
MSMPEAVHQICAPQDFSRGFAAIAHAKRGDIEGVQIVIDEANERNRLAELTFASLFALADIFKLHMGDGRTPGRRIPLGRRNFGRSMGECG